MRLSSIRSCRFIFVFALFGLFGCGAEVEGDSPAVEEPVSEAPVVDVPAADPPVEETPAENPPVEETPVEQAPVEEVPVEEPPVEETPVEEVPVEEPPVEETPVEEVPVEESPVEETPVDEVPVEGPPVEETPVEDPPADETNTPPVAEILSNTGYFIGDIVTLDGSLSSDPESDLTNYSWRLVSQPTGSTAILTSAGEAYVQIVPDMGGSYLVELTVSDGDLTSAPEYVILDIAAVVDDPVTVSSIEPSNYSLGNFQVGTNIYVDRDYVFTNMPLEFSGMRVIQTANSDKTNTADEFMSFNIDHSTMVYVAYDVRIESVPTWLQDWELSDLSIATTDSTYNVFQKAFAEGEVSLGGNFGPSASSMYAVIVDADNALGGDTGGDPSNVAPVANAGNDFAALVGQVVTVSGINSSDADGDSLSYEWEIVTRPTESDLVLLSNTSSVINFIPDTPGLWVVELTATDAFNDSGTDQVGIIVTLENMIPTADAGEDQIITIGDEVVISGVASSDLEGTPLSYAWELLSTPSDSSASLANADEVQLNFTPDVEGEYILVLTVSDGEYDSFPIDVLVQVEGVNSAPVADAGNDRTISLDGAVSLTGAASSDADGDDLTYDWTFLSSPGLMPSISNSDSADASFTPNGSGEYQIQLTISDGELTSQDIVTISVVNYSINVAWSANIDSTDGYIVYAGSDSSMSDKTAVSVLALGDISWDPVAPAVTLQAADVDDISGSEVCISVAAYNAGGSSAPSDAICVSL